MKYITTSGVTYTVAVVRYVAVRPLDVITNILIRSMGPVSEEDMVGDYVQLTVYTERTTILPHKPGV